MSQHRSKIRGFSLLELVLAFVATQNSIKQAEIDTAENFGLDLALYSNAVAEYIADKARACRPTPSPALTG